MEDTEYPGPNDLDFWLSRLKEPNFVYVIQAIVGGPVKIGVAKNPLARLAQLQTGNPLPLRLLYVVPGDRWLEAELHKRANITSRTTGGTEWFNYCEALEPLLLLIHALGDEMKAAYDGSGDPPPYPGEIGRTIYFKDYAPWATPKTHHDGIRVFHD
jgi:hypothetical protein